LVLLISPTGNGSAQSIEPLKNNMQIHADQTVTLSCKYKGGGGQNNLFWYRQNPGSRPENLLMVIPGSGPQIKERFNATANETVVDLIISSTAVSDSALYYCALRPTVTETHQTLY
uniref:Ig-like domain-containing protein n=1 Tax=Astyanax mexicanus TaxID=7994 RepID=A0A8B9R4T7_ASTMX